jgi:enoyl-CoA hydratase/carnithine racemase
VNERNLHPDRALTSLFIGFEKPMIAAVNGVAAGGGLAIALAADIILAAETARFGAAHVKLGLPVLDMLGYLLPRRIGPGLAAEMAFTGRIVGAEESLRIGLADRVLPASELDAAAMILAKEIAKNAPLSLYFSKLALRRHASETYQEYSRFERYIFGTSMASDDAKEAMRARRENREPRYKGS